MYPIYKFELTIGLSTFQAFPIYRSLSLDYEKESGQEFFRGKLNGTLTFESADYTAIKEAAFDARFGLEVFISQNGGTTWTSYWAGYFYKTDCDFDDDAQTVSVKPTVLDRYTAILAGMEKEFNLIELAPEIVPITADKRPLVQVYVPGDTVIGCFLAGMWWEQECEAESNQTTLQNTYHFYKNTDYVAVEVTGTMSPDVRGTYVGQADAGYNTESYTLQGPNGYSFRYHVNFYTNPNSIEQCWEIVRDSDDTVMFGEYASGGDYTAYPTVPAQINLAALSGVSTGTAVCTSAVTPIFARMICDTVVQGATTYDLDPATDIVPDNRNYHKVVPYQDAQAFVISTRLTATATEWGLYQPGQYYLPPDDTPDLWAPMSRSRWGSWSLWFDLGRYDRQLEASARAAFTIRHSYPIYSVLSVLLGEIAPGVTHAGSVDYSQFLYGVNLLNIEQVLCITPKSNIVTAGYDEPAQKAPITLKNVLEMLRDCFRCYWFVDDQNRFRVEHIQYFRNGGSYSTSPAIGIDLTAMQNTRNGKPWSFGLNQWKYDKPDMTQRYQFGWMDDVTQLFDGYPIDIISGYVEEGKVENIDISRFTSDIDYILLNPGDVSKDGFVLLAANTGDALPYLTVTVGQATYTLQNGWVSFSFLQQYYKWDLPAYSYMIHGVSLTASGVKRLKTQQVTFPARTEPDLQRLVKTALGGGVIRKISINLSSRTATATLDYDTEQ